MAEYLTQEQFDQLPEGAVVLDDSSIAYQKVEDYGGTREWYGAGMDVPSRLDARIPLVLLWTPEEATDDPA